MSKFTSFKLGAVSFVAVLSIAVVGCTADVSAPEPESALGQALTEESTEASAEALTGAACANASPDAQRAYNTIRSIRQKLGMPLLSCDPHLTAAANAHALYEHANGILTHTEVLGKPDYYATNFWERDSRAGFTGQTSGEVAGVVGDGAQSIVGPFGWMTAVYHRTPFISYNVSSFGFGNYVDSQGRSSYALIDFGSAGAAPAENAIFAWPVSNDTGVLTTFTCNEAPNPCPGGASKSGYPISITGGNAVSLGSHTIVVAGSGANVPHAYFTSAYAKQIGASIPASEVFLIPNQPLQKNTEYTVKVSGTVGTSPFNKTWSFTTGGT